MQQEINAPLSSTLFTRIIHSVRITDVTVLSDTAKIFGNEHCHDVHNGGNWNGENGIEEQIWKETLILEKKHN